LRVDRQKSMGLRSVQHNCLHLPVWLELADAREI
jgi:hypothetical protein